jgi:HTH-type transcriptional regulator/antitoxin HigA
MLESKSYIATPPGATIKEQLDDRGMTQKEFAKRMGMSEKHISKLVNGDVHLTPETAEKLERVLGVPARFWNKLEAIYQEKIAKVNSEKELEKEKEYAKKFPYNQMAEWGLVPKVKRWQDKIENLCKYFEVSCLSLLENRDLMPIACRKLANTEKSMYILLTLAQYAKREARGIDVAPFHIAALKDKIKDIRALTLHKELDFQNELAAMLSSCGIALVYLPQLPGSFLHGITFYDDASKKVVLGISLRGKYADRFWFSLFHEIAHILKGHIRQKNGVSEQDEREADRLAAEILIPTANLERFYQAGNYSIDSIEDFASHLQVGEDIVIGRLQNDKKIRQDQLNQYKNKYESKVS